MKCDFPSWCRQSGGDGHRFSAVFSGRSATESELFVSTEERQRYWSCWSSTLHRSFYCLVPSQCKIPQIHPFYILTKKSRFSNNRLRWCWGISGVQVAMRLRGMPESVYWDDMRAQLAEQGRFVSFCGCNQSWSTFFEGINELSCEMGLKSILFSIIEIIWACMSFQYTLAGIPRSLVAAWPL